MSSKGLTFSTDHLLSSDPEHAGSMAHLGHGVIAGLVGAVFVAAIFLLIDSMTAQPMATPNALGHALFLGQPFDLMQPLAFVPIAAYTALHGAVFIGIAYFGAALVSAMRGRVSSGILTLTVGIAMFMACQAGITSFAFVSEFPSGEFDLVRVGYANFFSALLMARLLVWMVDDSEEEEA